MTITIISSGNEFSNAHFAMNRSDIVPSGGFTIDPRVADVLGRGAGAAPVPVVSSGVVLSGPVVPQAFYQLVEKGGVTVDAHVSGGSQFVFGRTTGTFVEASSNGLSEYGGEQLVESGGRSVRTRLGEGGLQYISSGAAFGTAIVGGGQEVDLGLAAFTTVMDGYQSVLSDGRAIDTRVGAGGTQYVEEGGLTRNTVVVNGGRQFILSGTAIGTIVQEGGTVVVESGVVVSGLTVSSGGEVVVDGGTLVDAHIANGAIVFQETLSSGMSASNIVVSAYFSQVVLSGATATDTTVLSGGTVILGGGSVTGLTVSSGGTEVVTNSVTVSGVMVGDGVSLNLTSGATARGGTVGRGGIESVYSDARTVDATVSGTQYVFDGGVAGNTTVASGGEQVIIGSQFFLSRVAPPGSASGTIVEAGGTLITSHGFIDSSGGIIIVGGVIGSGIVLSSGGRIAVASSELNSNSAGVTDVTIESGGVFSAGDGIASGVTVKSGGEIILVGGQVSGLTVEKGGVEAVGRGGLLVASKGMVLSGVQALAGGEIIYAGGRFVGLEVSSGVLEFVDSGGVLRNADVGDGVSLSVLPGGRASGVHVGSGGSIALYGGGKVSGLTLDAGGWETLGSGTRFDGVTISSGLTVRVADGATLTNAKVQSGGQIIYAGGTISGLTLAKGARVGVDTDIGSSAGIPSSGVTLYQNGYEEVPGGGQVTRTIVSGGYLILAGGKSVDTRIHAGGQMSMYEGSVARNTVVVGQISFPPSQSGLLPYIRHSELDVESGTAVGVAVAGGGILVVGSGGKAAGVSVKRGGTIVFAGGAVTGLRLGSGATEEVQHGAVLSGAIIEDSLTLIVDGPFEAGSTGSAVDATVGKGGTIVDRGGSITRLHLLGGGTEIVSSGGYVSKATVVGGATLIVSSGGGVGDSVILGGRETVQSGGIVTGTVTFGKHGRFAIAGAPTGLTVSGFHTGDLLELSSFQHIAGEKLSFVESADKKKGVLTVRDGTMKATITLFGQYVAAGFHLATDPAGGTAISYATSAGAVAELTAHH